MCTAKWILALALLCSSPVWSAEEEWPVSLPDADGKKVQLPVEGTAATVLVFVTPACPIANRYAPALAALAKEYDGKARFFRIYADPEVAPAEITAHEQAYAYGFPALRDPEHLAVKRCAATRTPEIVVLDAKGTLRYRGAVDDRYADFGKYRQAATKEYLRDALDAILNNREVVTPRTQALGCYIPELETEKN